MSLLPRFFVIALLIALSAPHADAAEAVYPPASRFGLVPPESMMVSKRFPGFEDAGRGAVVSVVELPASAYPQLIKGFDPELLKTQGVVLDLREEVHLAHGPGLLVAAKLPAGGGMIRRWALMTRSETLSGVITFQFPEGAAETYSDAIVQATLMSVVFRKDVPQEEQLSLLPYRLAQFGGFRLARVAPGGIAMLTDGPKDEIDLSEQSLFLIAPGTGSPESDERESFARRMIASTPAIKEIRIQRSEPLRIMRGQGHETIADAKDEKTGAALTVIQWLRFATTGHIRMIGIARKESWPDVFPKLREIRDGIGQ